jgi:hypothetical protein
MIREQFNHGFDPREWESAKRHARDILYDLAKRKQTIAYSDLVIQIDEVRMEARDIRLNHFLGEISKEDDEKGLGLSTVIVVHKVGEPKPGPGFFELAHSRGRDTSDIEKCWVDELNAVFAFWSKSGPGRGGGI